MLPIKTNCPHCNHHMEYWTMNDTIACTKCGERIPVEPCAEPLDTDMKEEGDATEL